MTGGKDEFSNSRGASTPDHAMGEPERWVRVRAFQWLRSWTGEVGEAVGHVETLPLTLSIPSG